MTDTITICFYGSSDHELEVKLADFFENDVDLIVDSILKVKYSKIKVITGGYGGIMNSIAEKFANKRKETEKNIEIIGITCDAYDFEVPFTDKYNDSNDYSVYNNVIIQSQNFTERIQAMAELSDVFIVLPGKQGTLSEFLITCESYSFGHYILNGKNTKILIHEYWRPLLNSLSPTNDSYFRKFNNNILEYFDEKNFESHICDLLSTSESPKNLNVSIALPLSDYWERIILELKCNICNVILGRLFHENGLLLRLKRSNEDPILGLDFGWFHTYNSIGRDGAYYSYSRKEYLEKTEKFFQAHNSIMLSTFMKDFDYEYINGTLQDQSALDFHTDKSIPEYNSHKYKSDFSKLSNFFNQENYGQTLIWKGFKTKLGDEISNTFEESDTDILIFSVFLLLNHKIPKTTIERINQLLSDFLLKASATKSGELFKEKDKDIINQATRAAISQVMARNTSHNIGAHVMNKLIGELNYDTLFKKKNYASSELKTLYAETIKKWNQERQKNSQQELTEEEQKQKILLDQISIFNNYVKCRMDYLADISFGTPLMQTNKYAYADLFKELDKVRLLLEHISGLDKWQFEIKFTRNGKEFKKDNHGEGAEDLLVAIPNDILGTQAFYNILENIIRNSAKYAQKLAERDENGESVKKPTVFTVNFIDTLEIKTNGETKRVVDYCECSEVSCKEANKREIDNALNEFIAVEVYDDIPVNDNADLKPEEIQEYNEKTGKSEEHIPKIDYLVFSQNKKLNENILQENKLRSYALGLVEMDASTAYLRKRPVEYINHQSYDIQYDESWSRDTEKNRENNQDPAELRGSNCRHFLKAFKKMEDGNNYLSYRFFLHRPAVVLVVTDIVPKNHQELKKQGIWVVPPHPSKKDEKGKQDESFETHLKEEKVYPHEFVVIDSNVKFDKVKVEIAEKNSEDQETKRTEEIEFLEYYKTSLPIRVLNTISDLPELLTKSADEIEGECWKIWELSNDVIIAGSFDKGLDKFQAIFLDHLDSSSPSDTDDSQQKWEKEIKANHVEALSSLAQSKMPDFLRLTKDVIEAKVNKYLCKVTDKNIISETEYSYKEVTIYKKLVEAIMTKVIVIDERIQNATKDPKDDGRDFMTIPYKSLYEKMNVRVPDLAINLSSNSYSDDVIKDIEGYITSQVADAKSTDFILIHYSIFERMYSKEKINVELNRLLGKSKINVVFTSGRGTPDNLSNKVRFVNLSSVITAFVEVRSKYIISYLLNSSRKSNKT